MKLTVDVCDVCQNPSRPVKSYTIAVGTVEQIISGKAPLVTVERCEEHGAEFEALVAGIRTDRGARVRSITDRPTARRGNRPRITTMEEIEARKTR